MKLRVLGPARAVLERGDGEAAPLSLRFARGGSFWGILLSIVLGFVYYNIIFFAKIVGANGAIPPALAGWSQNILFGLLALFLILREE